MPGLGTSFGRGAATNPTMDLRHADSIFIMGSNMAECHPVAFRFVIDAKTRPDHPATVIHADPRFTRTSAMANIYAPLRAGSDIVFADRPNDLVVPTEGCYDVPGVSGFPITDRLVFAAEDGVDHNGYWRAPGFVDLFDHRLTGS